MSKQLTKTRFGISSYVYLADFRNEMKAGGTASGSISMLDVFIQKRCIPVVWIPFSWREAQIALMKLEESLQWINSSEVNVSRLWIRSLHKGSACSIMDRQQ